MYLFLLSFLHQFHSQGLPYTELIYFANFQKNEFIIALYKAEREFKIGKYKVDALLVLKNKDIIILEVDIFNRTSKEKYINIKKVMDSKGLKFKMLIVEKRKNKNGFCEEILLDEIEKIKSIV